MTSIRTRVDTPIDALAAPEADGAILVWPGDFSLADMAIRNRERLRKAEVLLLDRPLSAWRQPICDAAPVIMAGHQPDFIHPGVWVKHPAATRIAARLGGEARYLLVDSDVPDRLRLEWPVMGEQGLQRAFALAPPSGAGLAFEQFPTVAIGAWTECLAAPDLGSRGVMEVFADAFLNGEGRATLGSDYVSRWISGVQAIEQSLGLSSPSYVRVSEIFDGHSAVSEAALALASHLVIHARQFAACYNTALAGYRTRRGIRGRQHPIPDLFVSPERVELPFWLIDQAGPRRRMQVSQLSDGEARLLAGDDVIATVELKQLRSQPRELIRALGVDKGIRPRALAVTMFSRLLACDLFIHGIGGAKYDQITDEIIRGFLGIEPPAYACASATLRLPLGVHAVTRQDVLNARRLLRDIRYNPQRFLHSASGSAHHQLESERAKAIAAAQTLAQHSPDDHRARRLAFERIRELNKMLYSAVLTVESDLRGQLTSLEERLRHNALALTREWFFALHAPERLHSLAEAVYARMT